MDVAQEPRSVTLLGCTGSVGTSTADLLARHPERYRVEALAANCNVDKVAEQARRLRPRFVAMADESVYADLKAALGGNGIELAAGSEAVVEAARRPSDVVIAAIVGAAGLRPTLAAVRRGAVVGLANKETLVCAGDLVMAEARRSGAAMVPVDSEHSAIFQVLDANNRDAVDKLVLTASGGPFRTFSRQDMAGVTPQMAVAHPNWSMGAKISVDSATMMNKGLEIIEAVHLFGFGEARIEVLVHPQSVIHSMVSYVDGSVLAQLGTPDMRTPISLALGWPRRLGFPAKALDLAAIASLTFEKPDPERFPALRLAREVLRRGGTAPTLLNAANEVAVQAFLAGRIPFLRIARTVEAVLDSLPAKAVTALEDVLAVDGDARRLAEQFIARDQG
ncbi:1-deoxy-D-xylulose 5-phosphate reductoisomerase [mine drainage metagenome]|uniref:1-deoxy-D-xylulose-5-phosphate reductoisomerase n=1 Tax=mine drainage metagenome TaxID=410659 RepID=A0A1J5RG07_9ZZZZ